MYFELQDHNNFAQEMANYRAHGRPIAQIQ